MYLQATREILFNEEWVLQSNWLEVIATSFHECRHAYQHYCVETKTRENDDTISQWARELSTYFQPDTDKPQELDVDYLQQSIEIDAIGYTHDQMKQHFNVVTVLPDCLKKRIKK